MRIAVVPYCAALMLSLAAFSPVFAAQGPVVNVKLQDSSTDGSIRNMSMSLDQDVVKAGPVTFRAVNQSKELVHELIVVKVDPKNTSLPYNAKKGQVIEARIRHLGEISDLKPGASGTLTLKLKPGSYVLICNEPGHYKAGMSASFTVRG